MQRWCGWLAINAAILFSAPATARETLPLTPDGHGIERVDATVAGHRGTFLFDSGIGTTTVTPAFAALIGCRPWGKITGFRATGERIDLPHCNATTVSIGSTTAELSQPPVLDLARVMGPLADGLAGAIGLDAFAGRVVTLDVAHHRLIVEDDASFAAVRAGATHVPIRLVRQAEGAALTADIGITTAQGRAWMELDTGNYGPSMVDKTIARLFGLDPSVSTEQAWRIRLAADAVGDGPVVVKDLILDGNIGRTILRHWLVTLDLARGQGWIRAAA